MLYNKEEHSRYMSMAGRISVAAAVVGFAVFLVAFLVDMGSQELSKVSAQTATTSLTVLNTPPQFVVAAYEVPDSATSTPVNTGDTMTWEAIATDSNSAPYFLIICSDNATPTADWDDNGDSDGNGPPRCQTPNNPIDTGTAIQWGVSASTTSGELATVSTTTASTAISQFGEVNEWYAWVCDDDQVNPRCSNIFTQGPTTTTASSSPFHVNNRPNLSAAPTPTAADPGGQIVFTSTSDDPDIAGGADEILIVVCQGAGDYNPTTNDCDQNFLASTTVPLTSDASATYTLASVVRDADYPAYVFLVDEHGHESVNNPIQADFTVNNVAPVIIGGDIELQVASSTLVLEVPGGETPGYTLDFKVTDANSCLTISSTTDEIRDYNVALFRDDFHSTSSCDGVSSGQYDPNNCYTTGVATTTWDLDCTSNAASACVSPAVDEIDFNCTFPLWFVADPTDVGAPTDFETDVWNVGVAGADDDFATSSMVLTDSPKDLELFTALDLLTAEIPYGSLEPGTDTGTFNASTTVISTGNTGLDQEVTGESMCGTFAIGNDCPESATSTIPENQQRFSSTTFTYSVGPFLTLSSTTNEEVELDVLKTTATSSPNNGTTYWGIAVPASIELAGSYQGLNTFFAVTSESDEWE